MLKMFQFKSTKIFVSSILIISMIAVNSVFATKDDVKPPNSSKAQVNLDDINSLNHYISHNRNEVELVSSKIEMEKLKKSVSKNKELRKFADMNYKNLSDIFKDGVYVGKSQDKYNVFVVSFEADDNSFAIVATYEPNRDLLLDAAKIDHSNNENISIKTRNLGLTFKGTMQDVETLKHGTDKQKNKIKEKFINEHRPDLKDVDKKKDSIEEGIVSSLFGTNVASASHEGNACSGMTQNQCTWTSVAYCAASSLLGFWPGVICSIGLTLVCTYSDDCS
jgi:hypothetical protein